MIDRDYLIDPITGEEVLLPPQLALVRVAINPKTGEVAVVSDDTYYMSFFELDQLRHVMYRDELHQGTPEENIDNAVKSFMVRTQLALIDKRKVDS